MKQELGIKKIVTVIMVTLRRNTTAKKKKKQKKGPENEQTNLARLRIWSGKVAQVNKTKMLNENVKSISKRKKVKKKGQITLFKDHSLRNRQLVNTDPLLYCVMLTKVMSIA